MNVLEPKTKSSGKSYEIKGITVRDITRLDIFKGTKVLAGAQGLDRVVKGISVMDVPEPTHWIKGNEFIITAGYTLKDDLDILEKFIIAYAKKGTAGLGIKIGRFIDRLPPNVCSLANRLSFPIIELPFKYSAMEMINAVLGEILGRQAKALELLLDVQNTMTQMVLTERSLEEIAKWLSRFFSNPICILTLNLKPLAIAVHNQTGEAIMSSLLLSLDKLLANIMGVESLDSFAAEGETDSPLLIKDSALRDRLQAIHKATSSLLVEKGIHCTVTQVVIQGAVHGFIIVPQIKLLSHNIGLTALEQAATVVGLELVKRKAIWNARLRVRDDFIDDLLNNKIGSEEEIRKRARFLGWTLERQATIVLVNVDDFSHLSIQTSDEPTIQDLRTKLFRLVSATIKTQINNPIAVLRSDTVVCIWPSQQLDRLLELAEIIRKRVADDLSNLTVSIGIGRPQEPGQLYRSYIEAEKALEIGHRIWGKNRVTAYSKLGIPRLLSHISLNELENYCWEKIGAILKHDRDRGTDYLKTLELYLETDCSLKQTANTLFIHPSTVKYRLKQVRDQFGIDLSNFQEKAASYVALKAYSIFLENDSTQPRSD